MKIILLMVLALPCFGQKVGFVVIGGVPITGSFQTDSEFHIDFGESASSATRRYTVGPGIELRLPYRLGVECDALYTRLGFAAVTKSVGVIYTYTNASANSWEFPVLAKYRLPMFSAVKPYVEAGPSFRIVSGVSASAISIVTLSGFQPVGPIHSSDDPHFSNRSNAGVAVGLGTDFKAAFLHITPGVRYTRWRMDRYADPFLSSNQNQVEILLGVRF